MPAEMDFAGNIAMVLEMSTASIQLSRSLFDAVIFDMDGVVTRTAKVHAAAWKETFDDFLRRHADATGRSFEPFDIKADYLRYVDGKPRYDGVRDFLASRGIDLPMGEPDDPPGRATVCGLGNRKNRRFRAMLAEQGAERYESTIDLVRRLKAAGIAAAVISASKNCRQVLQAAGIEDLFEVRVDGNDAARLDIPGKPQPAIFLRAARGLGVAPRRTVVVEDALAGVEAGRRGGFGLIIGVDRGGQAAQLARFADVVISDLKEVSVTSDATQTMTDQLPAALCHLPEIGARLRDRRAVVFIDYDGTLTPIVDRPELARLSNAMRQALRELAGECTVAIVSGRDLSDVRDLVGLDGILYAGSHGFDISGPGGHLDFQQGRDYLPALDAAEQALRDKLQGIEGSQVERKRFAVAVHFRRVADGQVSAVEAVVDEVLAEHENLRKTGGKKIFELRPDIAWDKGKAIAWMLKELGLHRDNVLPVYIGDDLTDEDAFRELRQRGLAILVRDENRPTFAHYALENPEEVGVLLETLAQTLREGSS